MIGLVPFLVGACFLTRPQRSEDMGIGCDMGLILLSILKSILERNRSILERNSSKCLERGLFFDPAPAVRWVSAHHRVVRYATTAAKMEPLPPVWSLAPWPMLFRSSVSCGEIFTLVERLCRCAAYTVFRR